MGWIQTLLISVSIVRSESRASRSPCYGGASQCFHYTAFEGISLGYKLVFFIVRLICFQSMEMKFWVKPAASSGAGQRSD